MSDKILCLLGFAAKSGRLSFGMDASKNSACCGLSKLILASCDVSDKSKKEIKFYAEKYSVKAIVLKEFNKETVSDAVGRNCGIISINDSGFADAILKAYVEGGNAND